MLGVDSLYTAVIRRRYSNHGDLCLFDSYPMSNVWGRSIEKMQSSVGKVTFAAQPCISSAHAAVDVAEEVLDAPIADLTCI